jgi:hypothetical protein
MAISHQLSNPETSVKAAIHFEEWEDDDERERKIKEKEKVKKQNKITSKKEIRREAQK